MIMAIASDQEEEAFAQSSALAAITYLPALRHEWVMLKARPDSVQSVTETDPSPQSKIYRRRSPSGSSADVAKDAVSPGGNVLFPAGMAGWPGGELTTTSHGEDQREEAFALSSALAAITYLPALCQEWAMLKARPDSVQSVVETDPSPQSKIYRNRSPSGSSADAAKDVVSPGRTVLFPAGMAGWPGGELTTTFSGDDQGEEALSSIALTLTL